MCVPGSELALLVRVAVDRVVEEVRADAAVVEQRVALAGRAVAGDRLPARLASMQERQQVALGLARTCSAEAAVGVELGRSRRLALALAQLAARAATGACAVVARGRA